MKKLYVLLLTAVMSLSSCSDYLDVIPDNITTIDMAFNNRANAKNIYLLATAFCRSYTTQEIMRLLCREMTYVLIR